MTDTTPDLEKLAERNGTNLVLNYEVESRADRIERGHYDDAEDPPTIPTVTVLAAHSHLVEQVEEIIEKYDEIPVEGVVAYLDEDGCMFHVPFDKVPSERIDDAQMLLAARFAGTFSEAEDIARTFAGLELLRLNRLTHDE